MEAMFCLKLASKHKLSQEVVSEVLSFSETMHTMKMELVRHQLSQNYGAENLVKVEKITDRMELIDSSTGLREQISSNYR